MPSLELGGHSFSSAVAGRCVGFGWCELSWWLQCFSRSVLMRLWLAVTAPLVLAGYSINFLFFYEVGQWPWELVVVLSALYSFSLCNNFESISIPTWDPFLLGGFCFVDGILAQTPFAEERSNVCWNLCDYKIVAVVLWLRLQWDCIIPLILCLAFYMFLRFLLAF